jgi:hypothetical protein
MFTGISMSHSMPSIDVFNIGNEIALPELYTKCVDSLCDRSRIVTFNYPHELRVKKSTDNEWSSQSISIRKLNENPLLISLNNCVNCYAIHTKQGDEGWQLRYIGQTDCKRAKQNIVRHLAPDGDRSNAVFRNCREAVRNGYEIGLRLIKVEPDTLRFFIQEKLVNELRGDNALDWNQKRL